MATVYRKAKAGVEDLAFDDQGTGSTQQTMKSDGTYRTVRRINDTHIPTSAAIRALSATAITVYNAISELWTLVMARLPKAGGTMTGEIAMGASKITGLASGTASGDALHVGQVDGTSIVCTAGVLSTPAAGLPDSKLAQITTASKVSGAAITALASVPAGAGELPIANVPSITKTKLAWSPGFYPFIAGISGVFNPAATTYALAIANVAATDVALIVIASSTASVSVNKAVCVAGAVNLTFSADPGAGTTVNYLIYRAIP